MANYLIRNVVTNQVFGPYHENEVPAVLWGKTRNEWAIFKEMQEDVQVVSDQLCERRSRASKKRRLSPKNEKNRRSLLVLILRRGRAPAYARIKK